MTAEELLMEARRVRELYRTAEEAFEVADAAVEAFARLPRGDATVSSDAASWIYTIGLRIELGRDVGSWLIDDVIEALEGCIPAEKGAQP